MDVYLQKVRATEEFQKMQEHIETIRKEKTVYPPEKQVSIKLIFLAKHSKTCLKI